MLAQALPLLAVFVVSVGAWPPASIWCDIHEGWDIKGNDFKNVPGKTFNDCSYECAVKETNNCWAWTWTNYNGGTCWLKIGVNDDEYVWNPNAVSARAITRYQNDGGDSCYLLDDVDFYGNDIASKPASKPEDCCEICEKYDKAPGCKAYSWSNYNGGTCWLKSQQGSDFRYAPGVKSATIFAMYNCRDAGIWPIEKDVDYVDHDVANQPGSDPSKCGALCHPSENCTAFSWSNLNGGTCWLKSAREKTVAKSGVTSAAFVRTSPQPNCY